MAAELTLKTGQRYLIKCVTFENGSGKVYVRADRQDAPGLWYLFMITPDGFLERCTGIPESSGFKVDSQGRICEDPKDYAS